MQPTLRVRFGDNSEANRNANRDRDQCSSDKRSHRKDCEIAAHKRGTESADRIGRKLCAKIRHF